MARKLNDTQLTVLSNAASRDNHRVLPLPKLKAPTVAVRKTLATLLAHELIKEIPASRDDEVWSHSEETGNTTLIVTGAGLAAIGIEDAPATSADKPDKRRTRAKKAGRATNIAKKASRARTGDGAGKRESKQDALLKLLRSARGATIGEMQKATGWAPHSIRGWMSGTAKKRLGLAIASEKDEGTERRYFVSVLKSK